jgi:hypothetical protein
VEEQRGRGKTEEQIAAAIEAGFAEHAAAIREGQPDAYIIVIPGQPAAKN